MNQETIDYYDRESGEYSDRRYNAPTIAYSQYLFKKRRDLFLSLLKDIEKKLPAHASILEIGCADGVLFKAIEEAFPKRFSKLVGIDISPKMIDQAAKQNSNPRAIFLLRNTLLTEKFDIVIELGVHPYDLEGELKYVLLHLKLGGIFFYDVSGSKSIYTKIKNEDATYLKDYKTYRIYETFFSKYFSIEKSQVYGLFIPKLWAIPVLGGLFQPVFDFVFQKITPELFHEKIYCLKKKS